MKSLNKALDAGKVSFAGLDVFVNEPIPSRKILTHPKISLTPHTGASTLEAQDRNWRRIGDAGCKYFKNFIIKNSENFRSFFLILIYDLF